jgi:hypothetical protein
MKIYLVWRRYGKLNIMASISNEDISIEELTKERTPLELRNWWYQKNNEVYYSSDHGRKALRLHKRLAKQFMEEVLPLALFGVCKFNNTEQILIQPVIGNQNYDAIMTDLRTTPASKSYLEITQSHEGVESALRRFALYKKGWVPGYGKIKRTGDQVDVEAEAFPVEAPPSDGDLENILTAAKKKEGKSYPANTFLIIFFDSLHFPRVLNITKLDDFVNKYIVTLDLRFSMLYLISLNNVFREYSLVKTV